MHSTSNIRGQSNASVSKQIHILRKCHLRSRPFVASECAGRHQRRLRAADQRSDNREGETVQNEVAPPLHSQQPFKLHDSVGRRHSLLFAAAAFSFVSQHWHKRAEALEPPPQGYKLLRDRLDGYSFFLPETWTPLSSSGNDVFYRNPYNVNENLFVSISSPSSSKYNSVDDLISPTKAAERTKQQYLRELLSTRLGVKRTTEVVSASDRIGSDGKKYYDLELEAKSYASRNQLAVSQKQIDAAFELEWNRRYVTVLGVANRRLYEFRLQTAKETYDQAKDTLLYIAHSFKCTDVET